MKAQIKAGYEKNRTFLADVVPLKAPFSIAISSSQKCNFRCDYCAQSLSLKEKKAHGYNNILMEWNLFLELVRQLKEFDVPMKRIAFTGLGEPLLNPQTPDMVKVLNEEKLAEIQVDLYTNGYLLDEDMTRRLVDAKLTRLRISLQGLNSEQYQKTAGVHIDFERLLKQITYFYQHRNDTILYIKIIDALLNGEQEEDFYALFGSICDEIFIEHLVFSQPLMGDYGGRPDSKLTIFQESTSERVVCPQPFYLLQIDAEGNVFPCSPLGLPLSLSLGNIKNMSLKEMWNGGKRNSLLISMLDGKREKTSKCYTCQHYKCFLVDADNLDEHRLEILRRMAGKSQ